MTRQAPNGRSVFRLILMPALAVGLAVGCNSSNSSGGNGGSGGKGGSGNGGSGSGGTSAKGGSSGNGGAQSGGNNAGGSQSGGNGAGGNKTGGNGAGGSASGGSGSGGSNAGGSNAGGSNAGGSNAGGSNAGGNSAGGSNAGGSNAGGSNAGGSKTGGSGAGGSGAGGIAGSGGSATGGSGAGGSGAGGTSGTGGTAGPVTCGSVTIPSSNDIISDFSNGSLTTPVLSDRGGNTWDTWSSVATSLPKTSPNVFEVDSSQSGPCNRGGSLHVKSANEGTAKGNNVGFGIDLKPFVDVSKKTKSTFDAKGAGYTGVGFWMKCSTDVEYVLFKIPDANNDRDVDGPTQPCTYGSATDPNTCNQFGWKNYAILKNSWQYLRVFFDEVVPDIALTPRTGAGGTFDPSKLTAFQVQVNVGATRSGDSAVPNPFECWVDDVYFLKDTPPSKAADASPKTCSSSADSAAPGGYYTSGNKIMDCKTGNQKIFKGIARPSLEFDWAGWNINYPDLSRIKDFGANVVRYSLNQSYWLDSAKGSIYQKEIDNIIKWTLALGMDVILDLHWLKSGQAGLPDSDSATFWQQVATKYKNDGRVIFEIYNEPFGTDGSGWKAAMQPLVDAIRNTASAKNLILAGGLDWAYHLDQVLPANALTGSNIAYVTHPYDIKTNNAVDTSAWDAAFGNLAKTYPVVATEFGQTNVNGGPATPTTKTCNADFYKAMLSYFADSSRTIGWTGWSWFVDHYNSGSLTPTSTPEETCGFPQLITSYDGTTNSAGTAVKAAMK